MTTIDLSGDWSLTDDTGKHACKIGLPGDGISALHDAGLIPDPYFGRNEYDLRWICERDWVATRTFELEDVRATLKLSRIDTVATILINDVVVKETNNAFCAYDIPLGKVGQVGTNTISITFHAPVAAGKALADAHDFEIPWSHNCPIPYGNFLRKPACDFGWDWNIALAPFGVYGTMEIVPYDRPFIQSVAMRQRHDAGKVTLAVRVQGGRGDGKQRITFDGQDYRFTFGDELEIPVQNPKLWWPVGQGAQHLYDLTITVGDTVETRRIGLRTIELITEKDDAGIGFKFRVNGRDVFCKGANWVPADALPSRITDEKTRDLLQSAVNANMNMVRVWGGGRYEPTSFYDTCDELGLLVWQDFMFACNLYPSDRAFIANVQEEVRDNVARLHHHACIALWCGDNELVGALDWYDVSKNDRDRYLVNYDRLNRAIEDALLDSDPHAVWWPSSPTKGPLNFGDSWHDDGSGDMHFWSVWHEGRDFDHYRDVAPRFCSEFGFQSYPGINAIRSFTYPEDRNIAAPVLEAHQKNAGGNARIAETMFRYFRWPEKFEDFVYLSQVQQALAIKTAVTHWRSLKPHCMGTLIWQLNDTWPVCSWSSLDYGGDWKVLHHAAKAFYAPLICTPIPTGDTITIRAINDTAMPVDLTVTLRAITPGGTLRNLGEITVTVGDTALDVFTLDALDATELLVIDWVSTDCPGRDVFAPHPYKSYDLLPAGLTYTVNGNAVTIKATGLALSVFLEADIAGRFSANNFDMLPGESQTVIFSPRDPTQTPTFTLRDLHSATYGKAPS